MRHTCLQQFLLLPALQETPLGPGPQLILMRDGCTTTPPPPVESVETQKCTTPQSLNRPNGVGSMHDSPRPGVRAPGFPGSVRGHLAPPLPPPLPGCLPRPPGNRCTDPPRPSACVRWHPSALNQTYVPPAAGAAAHTTGKPRGPGPQS